MICGPDQDRGGKSDGEGDLGADNFKNNSKVDVIEEKSWILEETMSKMITKLMLLNRNPTKKAILELTGDETNDF